MTSINPGYDELISKFAIFSLFVAVGISIACGFVYRKIEDNYSDAKLNNNPAINTPKYSTLGLFVLAEVISAILILYIFIYLSERSGRTTDCDICIEGSFSIMCLIFGIVTFFINSLLYSGIISPANANIDGVSSGNSTALLAMAHTVTILLILNVIANLSNPYFGYVAAYNKR